MRKGTLIGVAALLVLIAVPTGMASATVRPYVVGVGHPICTGAWNGAIEFSPALKTAGTAPKERIVVKAEARTCTGGTPAPTGGTVSLSKTIVTTNANRCSKILPNTLFTTKTDAIPFMMSVLWLPSGITPTPIAFPNLKVTSTTGGSAFTFHSVGTATFSYPDSTASVSIKTVQSSQRFGTPAAVPLDSAVSQSGPLALPERSEHADLLALLVLGLLLRISRGPSAVVTYSALDWSPSAWRKSPI